MPRKQPPGGLCRRGETEARGGLNWVGLLMWFCWPGTRNNRNLRERKQGRMEGINGPLNGGIKMVTLPLRPAPIPPTVQNPTHLGIEAALGGYFLLMEN